MLEDRKQMHDYHDEKQGLGVKIDKAFQFLQFSKEIEDIKKKEATIKDELSAIFKLKSQLDSQLKTFQGEHDHFMGRIQVLEAKLSELQQDEDFSALQTLTPIFSGESKRTIQGRIHELELKVRQINRTQGEWEAKRDSEIQAIHRIDKQIKSLLLEHDDIDLNCPFPLDGKQLLDKVWSLITSLKNEIEKLKTQVQQKFAKKEQQKGKCETMLEQFYKSFPETDVYQFSQSVEEISEQLTVEKKNLSDKKTFIHQELKRIEKELKRIDEGERMLERFIEGHHFTAPDILEEPLTSEEILQFTYNTKKYVEVITAELKKNDEHVESVKHEVERAKRKFREFCNREISDVKMRHMALNGVEHKQNYEDIVEFKKNMMTSVERATSYANEHIRQKDSELQAFINQIHSHLQMLVEELRQIPKKTKVKVLDDWKQIFTFTIPEWQEEEGKSRIRDYIEWILAQLETDKFLNEQGVQDEGKVRNEIEMWLQSKQLLQMVLNNEGMKVSCRKVTNDNKVTTRSYSWEQSNVWSGGEKWSKNMTLFLGILNYVAEKKQHILANMKRHRAVILDNPFGKASSDHVLSPVFFVAEQLGFQIIALTAHAEGKFLQDYFPVIYSCRLRASRDPNKKVMTKEKWLHHAYFQDHEPVTIDRLGETEQMALFE